MSLTKEDKISIKFGCVEYLLDEVQRCRHKIDVLQARTDVMDQFFNLVNRIGNKTAGEAYGEDRFWQAKKEIREACMEAQKNQPQVGTDA